MDLSWHFLNIFATFLILKQFFRCKICFRINVDSGHGVKVDIGVLGKENPKLAVPHKLTFVNGHGFIAIYKIKVDPAVVSQQGN